MLHAAVAILIKINRNTEFLKYETNFIAYASKIVLVYCLLGNNIKKENFDNFFQIFIAGTDYNCRHTFGDLRLTTMKGNELIYYKKRTTPPY